MPVGAGGDPGRHVGLHNDAGGQVAGNADVLDCDVFARGSQLSGAEQVGLFDQLPVIAAGIDELVSGNAELLQPEQPDLEHLLELCLLCVARRQENQSLVNRRADELGVGGRLGWISDEDGAGTACVFGGVLGQQLLLGGRRRSRSGGRLRRSRGRNGGRLRYRRCDNCRRGRRRRHWSIRRFLGRRGHGRGFGHRGGFRHGCGFRHGSRLGHGSRRRGGCCRGRWFFPAAGNETGYQGGDQNHRNYQARHDCLSSPDVQETQLPCTMAHFNDWKLSGQ